jgi:hypothetical protein
MKQKNLARMKCNQQNTRAYQEHYTEKIKGANKIGKQIIMA